MKHILTFILSLSFFASIGQVRLSDTANNGTFSYHLGSNFRGQYPKASCYLDRDASGAFAIRRVTGAVVTPYVSMSNYVLNGDVDTVFSSYIEKLNGIIMLSCGGSTPVETFAYCGAPVLNQWECLDTANTDSTLGGSYCIFATRALEDSLSYTFTSISNSGTYPFGIGSYTSYPFNNVPNIEGGFCDDSTNFSGTWSNCNYIRYYSFNYRNVNYVSVDDCGYYDVVFNDPIDTLLLDGLNYDMTIIVVNAGGDTAITNDIVSNGFLSDPIAASALRNVGVNVTDIDLNTTNATIDITAKPVKTSGTTYQSSSFKIEKIAYADIAAGTITGTSYNPNSGEQSNTFSLTTGKNTFKVSVEDTDGNVAYSIFQVTKTAL